MVSSLLIGLATALVLLVVAVAAGTEVRELDDVVEGVVCCVGVGEGIRCAGCEPLGIGRYSTPPVGYGSVEEVADDEVVDAGPLLFFFFFLLLRFLPTALEAGVFESFSLLSLSSSMASSARLGSGGDTGMAIGFPLASVTRTRSAILERKPTSLQITLSWSSFLPLKNMRMRSDGISRRICAASSLI